MSGRSMMEEIDDDIPALKNPDDIGDDNSNTDADMDMSIDNDVDDNIDKLDTMTNTKREELVADTAVVREAVTKVCNRLSVVILGLIQLL
jgi:hypothetical protein